jgi:hypothetical protein
MAYPGIEVVCLYLMMYISIISENDLNIVVYSINTAWNFATHLLRIIFAELFTSDNLRVYYSYFGGGKLKKRPLNDQRKSAIR